MFESKTCSEGEKCSTLVPAGCGEPRAVGYVLDRIILCAEAYSLLQCVHLQAIQCRLSSRAPSMPRPVRNSSSIFASAELPRFVFTQVSCWCSCVEVKTGGASSSPMFCRSSTIQNNCSSSLRTGNSSQWSHELGRRKELFRPPQPVVIHRLHLIMQLQLKERISDISHKSITSHFMFFQLLGVLQNFSPSTLSPNIGDCC